MILNKINNIYTLMDGDKMIASSDSDFQTDYDVKKLSKKNCDELFGVFSTEEIAVDRASHFGGVYRNPEGFYDEQVGYLHGFIEGVELNKDKLFTVEDMKKAIEFDKYHFEFGNIVASKTKEEIDEFIQSLQQPTEIEVKIVTHVDLATTPTDSRHPDAYLGTDTGIPFLDENGCLILIKK